MNLRSKRSKNTLRRVSTKNALVQFSRYGEKHPIPVHEYIQVMARGNTMEGAQFITIFGEMFHLDEVFIVAMDGSTVRTLNLGESIEPRYAENAKELYYHRPGALSRLRRSMAALS